LNLNLRTFFEFSFKIQFKSEEVCIRKVVSLIKPFTTIFYLKYFEFRKGSFGPNQTQYRFEISNFEFSFFVPGPLITLSLSSSLSLSLSSATRLHPPDWPTRQEPSSYAARTPHDTARLYRPPTPPPFIAPHTTPSDPPPSPFCHTQPDPPPPTLHSA
jgi:hypothetical protein